MRRKEPIDPQLPGGGSPVPIPPVENAWTAMRKRLDVEMPVGRKRRRGFWLFFLVLPLLLWWWIERGQTTPFGSSHTPASEIRPANPASGTHPGTLPEGEENIPSKAPPATASTTPSVTVPSTSSATAGVSAPIAISKTNSGRHPRKYTPGLSRTAPEPPISQQTDVSSVSAHRRFIRQPGLSSVTPDRQTDRQPDERNRSLHHQTDHPPKTGQQSDEPGQSGDRAIQHIDRPGQPVSRPGQPVSRPGRPAASPPANQLLTRSHELRAVPIDAQRVTWDRSVALDAPPLNPRRKAAAIAKPPKHQPSPPETPKMPRDRILFAAGLADNKSFPVGAQQAVDYNANLKKDIWFDYVPTPYFQYFPTRRIGFQFGIQFNSPQYTENVTIFKKAGPPIAPGSLFTQDTAIVVRKLYYFNFPLTIYYSPVRNIQLGVGIQYSNLRNGVALQNNVIHYTGGGAGQRDTVQASKFVSLKDNAPAYSNLKKSDWRALFEMNYYWRKITLGLQFQESLGDYLRTPVDGSQGKDRNSSFNLYLRYNIWEKRIPEPPRK